MLKITFALEMEIKRLHTETRLEPYLYIENGENIFEASAAISLKRIADYLDRIAPVERVEREATPVAQAMSRRHKDMSLSEIIALVSDYFFKLTHIRPKC
jgi:hypothetical protein